MVSSHLPLAIVVVCETAVRARQERIQAPVAALEGLGLEPIGNVLEARRHGGIQLATWRRSFLLFLTRLLMAEMISFTIWMPPETKSVVDC